MSTTETSLRYVIETARRYEDLVVAARAVADSFTAPDGAFIKDDLTEVEWRSLREALNGLDGLACN